LTFSSSDQVLLLEYGRKENCYKRIKQISGRYISSAVSVYYTLTRFFFLICPSILYKSCVDCLLVATTLTKLWFFLEMLGFDKYGFEKVIHSVFTNKSLRELFMTSSNEV